MVNYIISGCIALVCLYFPAWCWFGWLELNIQLRGKTKHAPLIKHKDSKKEARVEDALHPLTDEDADIPDFWRSWTRGKQD